MNQIKQVNILDMLDIEHENDCQATLSAFSCPLNKDVEDFIHNKAVNFAKQRTAITYLVYLQSKGKNILVGYYTLTSKFVSISGKLISKTLGKRISKFSQYDERSGQYLVSIPLIAQLGKNYAQDALSVYFSGSELLTLACNRVQQAQKIIGGKMVYIECSSNQKLYDFYSKNDFYEFGYRIKDKNELSNSPILIQMLRYFK